MEVTNNNAAVILREGGSILVVKIINNLLKLADGVDSLVPRILRTRREITMCNDSGGMKESGAPSNN